MQVGSNKERLIDFLMEQWRKVPSSFLGSVELFVTNEDKCFKIHSVSNVRVVIEEIPELKCNHEEADTRMFNLSMHSMQESQLRQLSLRVVILMCL